MSTYYIVDENGQYLSCDKTKRYRRLSGTQLYHYLKSPEAKGKRFYVDNETGVGVEIPPELISAYREEERRKQYVSDIKKHHQYKCVYLYEMAGFDEIFSDSSIADETVNVEDTAIIRIRINELHNALQHLDDDEMFYINSLYLSRNRMTQKQLALRLGVSQQTVSVRCRTILRKLRDYLSGKK